jgi:hypothetical protein
MQKPSMINWADKSQQLMKQAPTAPPPGGMAGSAIDWKSKISPDGVAGQVGSGMGAGMAGAIQGAFNVNPQADKLAAMNKAMKAPPPSQGLPPARQPMPPRPPMQTEQPTAAPAAPMPMQPQGVGPAMQPAQNMQGMGGMAQGAPDATQNVRQTGGPLVDAMTGQQPNPQMTAQVMPQPQAGYLNKAPQMIRAY